MADDRWMIVESYTVLDGASTGASCSANVDSASLRQPVFELRRDFVKVESESRGSRRTSKSDIRPNRPAKPLTIRNLIHTDVETETNVRKDAADVNGSTLWDQSSLVALPVVHNAIFPRAVSEVSPRFVDLAEAGWEAQRSMGLGRNSGSKL